MLTAALSTTTLGGNTELDIRAICIYSVLGVYGLVAVATTAVILRLHIHGKDELLAKRSVPLVAAQAVVGAAVGTASLVASAQHTYSCALKLWVVTTGVVLWLLVVAMRGTHHLLLAWASRARLSSHATASSRPELPMYHDGDISEPHRPNTAQTLDVWSEFGGTATLRSQNTLPCIDDHCSVVCSNVRFRQWVRLKPLGLTLATAEVILIAYAAIISAVSVPYQPHGLETRAACATNGGWEMWPPYGVAIICIGPVFLALEAAMWSIEDAYGTRTDIFVCMATSQLALVVYVLWIAVLDEVRSRLAEAFVFWLATLVAHIFSVCQPLWHSMRHRRWLAMQPSPGGFGYPYRGTRLRRSLYSSLYKEFQRTMEDCVQRERFLQFATHHYRSGLPAFLGDFQLLKYRVIEALQNHHGQPTIQLVNNDQHLYESHPLASTVPITKGIFESTMLLLPDGAISEHTQFPEAVKSTFSSFVCTYFGRESSMAISIPGDIVVGIQIAIEQNDVRLSILDRAKDEVLFLLCTDVFSEYRRRLDAQCADP